MALGNLMSAGPTKHRSAVASSMVPSHLITDSPLKSMVLDTLREHEKDLEKAAARAEIGSFVARNTKGYHLTSNQLGAVVTVLEEVRLGLSQAESTYNPEGRLKSAF